jgi:hypothetical protein
MGQINGDIFLLAISVASLVILCSHRRLQDALIEAINKFRGGPPPGMHPSPSNDGALLQRRLRIES